MARSSKAPAEWVAFEAAVAAFLSRLDPSARVLPNVRLPDRHTGRPRQRDVWIETRLLGHFPVTILVSCKRYRRKLNQQDIDAFEGERQSSTAQIGVIYSYQGFGEAAIEKAKKLGISCCRLYVNEPPELPMRLALPAYCYTSQIGLHLTRLAGEWKALKTYGDLFALSCDNGATTVLDLIVDAFKTLDAKAVAQVSDGLETPSRSTSINVEFKQGPLTSLEMRIEHRWKLYVGKREAYLANGSYSVIDGDFRGETTFPIVDLHGDHPGPGWELQPFPGVAPSGSQVKTILSQPDVRGGLEEALAPSLLDLVELPKEAQ